MANGNQERRINLHQELNDIQRELADVRRELHGTNGKGIWALVKELHMKVDTLVKQTDDQEHRLQHCEDNDQRGRVSGRWWAVYIMLTISAAGTFLGLFL